MAETIDIIEKLIQLALNNPNENEAMLAAMKVVRLLDKFQIPIGANVTILREADLKWTPPSQDFMDTVEDILKNKRDYNPDASPMRDRPQSAHGGLTIQNRDIVDQQEAWRTRMVDAWRALREERLRFQSEVQRYERETHRKFWGDGNPTRSW